MSTIEILQQYFYCLQAEEEVLLSVDEAETWSYFASSLLPQNSTKKHATQHDGSQDEVKLEEETEEKLCKPCCDLILAHFHQRFPSRLPPTSYKPTNNTANTTNTASSSSSSSGNGSGNVRKKATTRMQLAINLPTHHSGYKTIEVAMPEIFLPMYK